VRRSLREGARSRGMRRQGTVLQRRMYTVVRGFVRVGGCQAAWPAPREAGPEPGSHQWRLMTVKPCECDPAGDAERLVCLGPSQPARDSTSEAYDRDEIRCGSQSVWS